MNERPEEAEDWPLRDFSARLRPPAGAEPAEPLPTDTEAEILYEDDLTEDEDVAADDEMPALEEEEEERQAEIAAEAAPALEPEPGPEPAPEPESEPEPEPEAEAEPAEEHAEGEFGIPDGYAVLEGTPSGHRRSVAVVVSRFNGEITNRLLESALDALEEAGVAQESVLVMPVPGAFELPLAAMALAKTRRYACIVALGCVIRGETPHFDFVASEAASGLQLAQIETGVPVAFGLLTCDTAEQAAARVDRGAWAARTALEMADAFAQLRTTLAAARGQ